VCLSLLELASAHSWAQCTDYTEENGRTWSASDCRGWPRAYASVFQNGAQGFGADMGYNYQPGASGAACRSPPTSTDYTAAFPMATYNPGQRVCLAWPPKNHVAAKCENPNIGDSGTRIYRSGLNPTADPTLDQFHQNLVYDFGANTGTNGLGFQNCPEFCGNNDKALCTGCFDIPTTIATGKYTFLWEWAFNGPSDIYTTCFDVEIVANSGNYVQDTYTHQSPDAYVALMASGATDKPVVNTSPAGAGSVNAQSGSKGMSPGGAAVLAIFIIAIVGLAVGSFLFVKLGYGTMDTKFPFYHKNVHVPDTTTRKAGNYVAFTE